MEIPTQRLLLRDINSEDFDSIHAFSSRSEVSRYMDWGPNSPAQTQEFIDFALGTQEASPRRNFPLAIALNGNSSQVIGTVALGIAQQAQESTSGSELLGEIGYSIHPDYWGQGYASEAALAVRDFAFSNTEVTLLRATCRPENKGSAAVLQKIGMRYVKTIPLDKLVHGTWMDSLVFELSTEQWQSQNR